MDVALDAEGANPTVAAIARSIYHQESGSGKNTKTSNAGAVGGMQIIPATFHSVADDGWNIKDPVDNARAGVRYVTQLAQKAGGDPALTAAGYYGGPGAIDKARNGVAVRDPRNPNAPDTLQYGQQVAARIPQGSQAPQGGDNWWASAPLADAPANPPTAPQSAPQAPAGPQVATGAVQGQEAAPGQPASATANPDPNGYGEAPPSDNTQFALPGQLSPAQQAAAEAAKQPKKGWLQQLGDNITDSPLETAANLVHGGIDNITFGFGDKAGAALNAAVNAGDGGTFSDRYHNALKDVRDYEDSRPEFTAGQLASVFAPGAGAASLVGRAVEAVPTASRMARAVAGGAAGATEGAAWTLGHANDISDITPSEMGVGMGLGALGGSAGGLLSKATDLQKANSFLLKSGTAGTAQRDAEIIADLKGLQSRATQDGAPLGAADANALANRYKAEVAEQLRQMPKTEDRSTLLNALQRSRGLDEDSIQALRQIPNGDAVADAILKSNRTLALTARVPAANGMLATTGRHLVDNGLLSALGHMATPGLGFALDSKAARLLANKALGGAENRTGNIAAALKRGDQAEAYLKQYGQQGGNSLNDLATAAKASLGARAAAATASNDARAQQQGNRQFQNSYAAGQQARQAAAAANPNTPEAQAAAREYMFRAQQAGQGARADVAKQTQQAAQAEASVGPQMTATQRAQAQAQVAKAAQELAAKIGPQISPSQRSAIEAQRIATEAMAKDSLKTQLAQKQALADQQASDPTYLLGMSNPHGNPRNPQEMAEFAKVMRQQAEAAAVGPQVPAQGLAAAQQSAAAKKAAQKVAEVTEAGAEQSTHVNGISPSKRAQANLTAVKSGDFSGLDFSNPRARMMLAHVDDGGNPEALKAALKELATEDPDTAIRAIQTLTPDHGNVKFYGAQAALQKKLATRVPTTEELAAIPGSAEWKARNAPAPTVPAPALDGVMHPKAWTSAKESRQIIQKNALESAQDPEVKKLVAKLIDTKNVKGAKDPNVKRQEAFDGFMEGANTGQQIEAKRIAEPLIRYGK
jgi:hypothetical protein